MNSMAEGDNKISVFLERSTVIQWCTWWGLQGTCAVATSTTTPMATHPLHF